MISSQRKKFGLKSGSQRRQKALPWQPTAPFAEVTHRVENRNRGNDDDTRSLEESLDSLYSSRSLSSRFLEELPLFSPPVTTPSRSTEGRRRSWKKSASTRSRGGDGPAADACSDGGSVERHNDSASLASTKSKGRNRASSFRLTSARRFASSPTRLFKTSSRAPGSKKKIVDDGPSPLRGQKKMRKEQVATTPSLPISTILRQTPQHQSYLLSPLTPFTTADAASPTTTDVHVANAISTPTTANNFTNEDASPTKNEAETPERIERPVFIDGRAMKEWKIAETAKPATPTDGSAAPAHNQADAAEDAADALIQSTKSNNGTQLQSAMDSLRRNLKELRLMGSPSSEPAAAENDADGRYHKFLQLINSDDADGFPTHLNKEARESDDDEPSLAATKQQPVPEEIPGAVAESIKDQEDDAAEDHPQQAASTMQESTHVVSDSSFAEDGDACRCLWCPKPLLRLLRGGGFTLAPIVLPPQREDDDVEDKKGEMWQSMESMRAGLETMAETHARAAPSARADTILSEIRVIERSLDKIAALSTSSVENGS